MKNHVGLSLVTLGLGSFWWLFASPGYGFPGQSVDEAKTWMQGHPTLRAESREGLRVHRADIPSRRFTFQASIFPIGGFQRVDNNSVWPTQRANFDIVRREEFILVDYDEQVTAERLEESLRVIYGADVYADYRRAELIDSYGFTADATRGEVLLGSRYAYWLEVIPDANGIVTIGKLNVVLPEDVDRLQTYLQRQQADLR